MSRPDETVIELDHPGAQCQALLALLLTACGSSGTPPTAAATPRPADFQSATTARCADPGQDVIVRTVAPGQAPTAQRLGYYCGTTEKQIATTSPTQSGYCTEVAPSSDNPGYDADAIPAAPLKNVTVAVGPAC